ncbi:MAG: hypothetical protein ACFCVE_04560 [Phycisphaerae bacterium]
MTPDGTPHNKSFARSACTVCVYAGLALAGLLLPAGCGVRPPALPGLPEAHLIDTGRPTTAPAELAQAAHWWQQPAEYAVTAQDFTPLAEGAERVLRQFLFSPDLVDYRRGVITSEPLVAAQAWEFWRPDNRSLADTQLASTATYRRTVRWDISQENGAFVARPKVLVERYARRENRLTTPVFYGGAFSRNRARGSIEEDRGEFIPAWYWYAVGRDEALEAKLAQVLRDRVER